MYSAASHFPPATMVFLMGTVMRPSSIRKPASTVDDTSPVTALGANTHRRASAQLVGSAVLAEQMAPFVSDTSGIHERDALLQGLIADGLQYILHGLPSLSKGESVIARINPDDLYHSKAEIPVVGTRGAQRRCAGRARPCGHVLRK